MPLHVMQCLRIRLSMLLLVRASWLCLLSSCILSTNSFAILCMLRCCLTFIAESGLTSPNRLLCVRNIFVRLSLTCLPAIVMSICSLCLYCTGPDLYTPSNMVIEHVAHQEPHWMIILLHVYPLLLGHMLMTMSITTVTVAANQRGCCQ